MCIYCFRSTATGAVPRTTTKVDEEKTKTLSKTYHTIKDMIDQANNSQYGQFARVACKKKKIYIYPGIVLYAGL